MSILLQLVRQSRGMLLLALLCSLIGGLGNAGLLALINQALAADASSLSHLGMSFLVVGLIVLVTRTLAQTLFMRLGQQVKASLRMRTIRRIGEAAFASLERQGAAKSLAVLTQDLDTIVSFFIGMPALATQGALVVGCLAYLAYLSWGIFAVAVVTIVLGTLGYRIAHTKALFHLRASRKREDDLVRHFRSLFDGAKELKLHRARRRAFIDDTLATNVEAVRVQRTRGYVLYAAANSWGNCILFAFIGLTLFVFGQHLGASAHVMSGYAIVFVYMIMPIEAVLSAMPMISAARVALERIEQVNGELLPEPGADTHAGNDGAPETDRTHMRHVPVGSASSVSHSVSGSFGEIVLEGVAHRYFREKENGTFSLGPINATFKPGEIVYLIGGNGSGKTTLAKMLVGLYAPEDGRIVVDGKVIDEQHREAYRQLFSVVFSDFFLFDNLLGLDATAGKVDDEVSRLLSELQLDHKVNVRDGVFSTLNLSQGQRKRLALLVAYLEDRPFYVFDEWAADQDPLFKDVFYRQLLPALRARGKAVLVITHDDRYFPLADRYLKLEYGQLIEHGDGEALVSGAAATNADTTGRASVAAVVAD
ncbi:cyclic peptide export ABC transporter [Robbsia andropogonis]|uniref:cyclic peptide export ABC transporter n=1 Tax=Robbsia andropogonis TaxID=28092 RepID=UPI002A69CE87|nr:cyclic peptide export ABC transporter [Robbsia andropogonis]